MAFAVSTVVAAIGVVTAGVGTAVTYENSQKAAQAQAAAAQQQALIASQQAANVDVEKQELGLQTEQTLLQSQTQRDVIGQQAQADTIRQQAAVLDATRQRRDAVRAGVVARANNLTNATNSGANAGSGSTIVKQSSAGVAGQTNENVLGINQNLDVGTQLYNINQSISNTYLNASYKNDAYVEQSESLQDQVLDTQKLIYSEGGTASQDYASAAIDQGNAALGTGISSIGTALVNNQKTIGPLLNYFQGNNAANVATSNQNYATNSFLQNQPTDF